jgi:hypothetical protein
MEYPAGWTCERTVLQLEAYLRRTMTLGESLAVAEHVEACVECAQRLLLFRTRLVVRRRG